MKLSSAEPKKKSTKLTSSTTQKTTPEITPKKNGVHGNGKSHSNGANGKGHRNGKKSNGHSSLHTHGVSQETYSPSDLDQRLLLKVLMEVKNGNFNVRMPFDQVGLTGKICDTLNEIISLNEKM